MVLQKDKAHMINGKAPPAATETSRALPRVPLDRPRKPLALQTSTSAALPGWQGLISLLWYKGKARVGHIAPFVRPWSMAERHR